MADSTSASILETGDAQVQAPNAPRGRGRGRGGQSQGRGRGRGQGRGGDTQRGGGRGGNGNGNASRNAPISVAELGNIVNGKPPAAFIDGNGKGKESAEEEDDGEEVCFICATPVVYESVAPCNHRICHICSLRMRALYKDQNCAHCRTPAPFVIFTSDKAKRFEEFSANDIKISDDNIGIRYDNESIRDDTVVLLRYNCPDSNCDIACLGWPDLHRHVRSIHHKKICDLCSRHKKVFTHEHDLFTDSELHKHMRKGDDNPGAVDQTGFKGHPLCSFCNQRFYGDDELYVHCRDRHERCFICERPENQTSGHQPVYYANYAALEVHYRADHFVCNDRECMEKKTNVFASENELKAHVVEEHGSSMNKDARRDARTLDISGFDYRTPYAPERRGGGNQREQRDGRGRGRGRDPNAEPLPASSAQPLRRDEQAFQRALAIQSSQSVAPRTFGGQLTQPTPAQARAMPVARPSHNTEAVAAGLENLNLAQESSSPQEQARQLRHRAVIERASLLLGNDEAKMSHFRSSISSFKNSSLNAANLIDSFFALFTETSSSSLGTLVREISDLYEDPKKGQELIAAWNNWRAINEDYPSLPAAGGSSGSSIPLNWAVTTNASSRDVNVQPKSTRVLKLKSSTAQSSRSQVSQARSWGSASSASGSTASQPGAQSAFPGLPSAKPNGMSSKIQTVPWGSGTSSTPATARPTPPSSRPASTAPGLGKGRAGTDAFPALPKAAKPQSSIMGYGNGRMVKRDGWGGSGASTPTGNPWGPGGSASGDVEVVDEEDVKGKGKKKQGKKVVIMGWG